MVREISKYMYEKYCTTLFVKVYTINNIEIITTQTKSTIKVN